MRILHFIGARPNFMKLAPVESALRRDPGTNTGQQYDLNMSEPFFRQLDIPEPDVNLEVGTGSHTEQTAKI